jgi:hypothetical protein
VATDGVREANQSHVFDSPVPGEGRSLNGPARRRRPGNLVLSPFIYAAAGLLWNLEAKPSVGFHDDSGFRLSFVREDWPSRPADTRFRPIMYVSIPFILIAAFVLVEFVGWKA